MKCHLLQYLSIPLDFIKVYGVLSGAVLCHFFAAPTFAKNFESDGIIGGQGNAPYAAFVEPDGSVRTLLGLPPTGLTYRVAINSSREGLIGGTDGLDAYAALVTPNGTLAPITGLIAPGEIYNVAINRSGLGIIGGGNFISNIPYAALVSSNGTAISFTLPASGLIYGVALNDFGQGIIGGIGPSNSAYAALTSPDGTLTPVTGLPTHGGIFWTAINHSGTKFIGGQNNTSIYAAFIDSNGSLKPISGLPAGQTYSVAINASGSGIIGGNSLTLPYAALVSPNGALAPLTDLPKTTGIIYHVAINKSGTSIITGFSTSGPYGAFVNPTGSLTPLIGLPAGAGFLDGAAIDPSGIALVGGTSLDVPFAAIAAPNGTLTYLNGLPASGEINSTAIADLSRLVPKSVNFFNSLINTQFAFVNAFTQHCINDDRNLRCQNLCDCNEQCKETSSFWIAPFGTYVHEKGHHEISSFSNEIVGSLLGYDYKGIQDVVIGGALAYAFNHVRYSKKLDRAKINQESAVLYASLNKPCFYMNIALWGGLFQISNKRSSLSTVTSKANLCGWNLCPHIELSTSFPITQCERYIINPFVTFDWANDWQHRFREQGRSGLNITLNDHYASILRSEIGIRLYETFEYGWGLLILEEKGSYVNRTSTCRGKGKAHFIGAASFFDVETLSPYTQNLGVAQIHIECIPCSLKDFYASIDYQGEFDSSFQSHELALTLGKNF